MDIIPINTNTTAILKFLMILQQIFSGFLQNKSQDYFDCGDGIDVIMEVNTG
jgi:hypothetical protein